MAHCHCVVSAFEAAPLSVSPAAGVIVTALALLSTFITRYSRPAPTEAAVGRVTAYAPAVASPR